MVTDLLYSVAEMNKLSQISYFLHVTSVFQLVPFLLLSIAMIRILNSS